MTIHITQYCLYGYHGVLPQEREVGANFYYSITAQVACSESALVHDQLEGTVSYADICAVISEENARPSQLLEHLVYRIANRLKTTFPIIQTVSVRVDKENPPMGILAQEVGVEIRI